MDPQNVRDFARRHEPKGHLGVLEAALWYLAKEAPYGGTVIPPELETLDLNPYLLRVYLLAERLELGGSDVRPYLHHFFRGDRDRDYHNHPWRISYSWILTGGYSEEKWNPETKQIDTRVFRPGAFNVIRRDDYHKVTLLEPEKGCWTLFVSVDRLSESNGFDWEFLDIETGKKTPWGLYQQGKAP